MKEQHIARLEEHLERLVEGTFANIFGKHVRGQDIALELARGMEDGAEPSTTGDTRPLAPDHYAIHVNPLVRDRLLQRQPRLLDILSEHMIELAADAGYRLNNTPTLELHADATLSQNKLAVKTSHTTPRHHTTALLERVELKPNALAPKNPQLLINGGHSVSLTHEIINIGRSRENQIVLDDTSVSRQHLQLRLRFGRYILFDIDSHGGTYVNDVLVREHTLQTGDVIRIGRTQLVYMEDTPVQGETGLYEPVDL